MRRILFLLFFISLSFSMFGASKMVIERSWTIHDGGGPVDFKGALVVNSSNQRVIMVEVSEGAELLKDQDGAMWLRYRGQTNETEVHVIGKAEVEVDYFADIGSDPPLPSGQEKPTQLTPYAGNISAQAHSLALQNSSLGTITNLVNWVNGAVTYDEDYWDLIKTSDEVFNERRGVCVQYTHLLISMARSLGFKTRYVSGYVHVIDWQPHSWAEIYVPEQGWISADPTLGQIGDLDSTHLALSYGGDQLSAYDLLLSKDSSSNLSVEDDVIMKSIGDGPKDASIGISFEPESYLVLVNVTNKGERYLVGSYSFEIPGMYGSSSSEALLLRPGSSQIRYYGLNYSLFNDSFSYTIPVSASFNDVWEEKAIGIGGDRPCLASAFLLMLLVYRRSST